MPTGRRTSAARSVRAFAPGHVTGFFAPDLAHRDPRDRGSTGGGVVLELGALATATWRPSRSHRVRVRSTGGEDLPISLDVADRLSAGTKGSVDVVIEHALPIGQGFAMSAAGALSTGLAVARLLGRSSREAVEIAHLADLFGGGGLGGVAAILGGGVEVRETAGIPPRGHVRHRADHTSLLVGVAGRPLPSPPLLRDPRFLRRIETAARAARTTTEYPLDVPGLLATSERFTDALELAPAGLARLIAELRSLGVPCAQAMFGHSLFAAPPGPVERAAAIDCLERRRIAAVELRPATRGAHLVSASPRPLSARNEPRNATDSRARRPDNP
jgi:pantoate kinase